MFAMNLFSCAVAAIWTLSSAPLVAKQVLPVTGLGDVSAAGAERADVSASATERAMATAMNAGCAPSWVPGFSEPALNGAITALLVHDFGAGTGPDIYAAGFFTDSEDGPLHHIARWDGMKWHPLGEGLNNPVNALAVMQASNRSVLVAGGSFTRAGGADIAYLAQWDGTSWASVGEGVNGTVFTLLSDEDDASLIVGGSFTEAGGISASRIARWDGTSWHSLGAGMNDGVRALTFFDDGQGTGPRLIAGGQFTQAGSITASRVAQWDGANWSAIGSGVNNVVFTMLAQPTDEGEVLILGGAFTEAGGVPASRLASWNGEEFSSPGGGVNGLVRALLWEPQEGSSDTSLIVGGSFSGSGTQSIARWDGTTWTKPIDELIGGAVLAMVHFDESVFLGGSFTQIDTVQSSEGQLPPPSLQDARSSAQWIGDRLVPIRSGANDEIWALGVFDDGTGPALYAGGKFSRIGNILANYVAKWDGRRWTPLGEGLNQSVRGFTVYDDGAGDALYVAGNFTTADGQSANRIAKWDGTSWFSLGSGLESESGPITVGDLIVHDDGSGIGDALYVTGNFTIAGGVSANNIARWDGTTWSPLGSGWHTDSPYSFGIALCSYDDGLGDGPALFAAGRFSTAGGVPVKNIARWDGRAWSAVGGGLEAVDDSYVGRALTVYDDGMGAGPALYAAGHFYLAGGRPATSIARWDGHGPALYVGGGFALADSFASKQIAMWRGCPPGEHCATDLNGDGATDIADLLLVFAAWGACEGCPEDLTGNDMVDLSDVLALLSAWGPCP